MTSEAPETQAEPTRLLLAALANVPAGDLRVALSRAPGAASTAKAASRNAWNALRRHRDPASVFARPQYRAALSSVGASVSDECLARTIELLGDHSDDPTREQLLAAVEEVRGSFPDTTVAVMLASVALDDMPSSPLCAELLAQDPRFGLTDLDSTVPSAPVSGPAAPAADGPGASPEQRAARRAKKERERAERRRNVEVARRADDQVRQRQKQERSHPGTSG